MTTFYLDPVNGNDAANGSTFATAGLPTVGPWKTITSGASAARIAPGDVIRIAKSPDPTSLGQAALFTNLSKNVVLQSGAVTANICTCDQVAEAWTAGTGGTPSSDTANYKMGTGNSKAGNRSVAIAVSGAGTNAKLAYRDLGATGLDLSGYQQISFWIKNSVAILGTHYVIKLCSDEAGATPVNSFTLPAIPSTAQWVPITIDLAGALGNPIKSIALYSGSVAPGNGTINLDNILACKASSAADSLTLQSLISKNPAAQGGVEPWLGIQSINGTTILIDNHTNCLGNAGRGYTGATETVTIYKRETIKTAMAATSGTAVQEIQDSGTVGSLIEFQGGYNTGSNIQDGETWFDGLNGFGTGLNTSSKNFYKVNWCSLARYYNNATLGGQKIVIDNMRVISASTYNFNGQAITSSIHLIGSHNSGNDNLSINPCNSILTLDAVNGSLNYGIQTSAGGSNGTDSQWFLGPVQNNATYGIGLIGGTNYKFYNPVTANNGVSAFTNAVGAGPNFIINPTVSEATVWVLSSDYCNSPMIFFNFNGVSTDHRTYVDGGTIFSETSIRHTASGLAWKLSPNKATRDVNYPLNFKVAEIAVNANKPVTVSAWMERTNTGITGSLVCRGGQIAGVANDLVVNMDDSGPGVGNYVQTTLTFTPTAAGVVEIEVWAYGGTTYSVYVDDLSISQAA